MRRARGIALLFLCAAGSAVAQTTSAPQAVVPTNAASVAAAQPSGGAWSFSASANAYFPGDSGNYVQPTITADGDRLHLEARYNYEGLDSGSAWIGYNLSAGDRLQLDFTAMVGGVFGKTQGYAPGYELTLGWRKLQLYSEAEYVFDTGASSDSFLYTWSELTLAPAAWFQFGLVIQRTKTYQTNLDLQRGLMVRFTYRKLDLSAYVLNPDADKPTYVLGGNVGF